MSYKDYTYGKDYWIDNIYHVGKRKGGISIFGHSIKYHEDTKIWYTARFEGSSAGIDLDL